MTNRTQAERNDGTHAQTGLSIRTLVDLAWASGWIERGGVSDDDALVARDADRLTRAEIDYLSATPRVRGLIDEALADAGGDWEDEPEIYASTVERVMRAHPWVATPTTLDDLLDAMRSHADWSGCEHDSDGRQDWTELPTYGGEAPDDTSGVWSWDVDRLLVNSLDSLRVVDIVPRSEWRS